MTFTPRTNRALAAAEVHARSVGHSCVGSHHLVVGLFELGSGVQFYILSSLGITTESLKQSIDAIGMLSEPTVPFPPFVLGVSAVRALRRAERGAGLILHSLVGTEHVLMALLAESDGGAARVFAAHGIDTIAARRCVIAECGWRWPQDFNADA